MYNVQYNTPLVQEFQLFPQHLCCLANPKKHRYLQFSNKQFSDLSNSLFSVLTVRPECK